MHPVEGGKLSKRLNENKGCKSKNSSWDIIGLYSPMAVASGQQYNIREQPAITLLYTYIIAMQVYTPKQAKIHAEQK